MIFKVNVKSMPQTKTTPVKTFIYKVLAGFCHYPNTIITSPVLTESPLFTRTSLIVPDDAEKISFSIFIASSIKTRSPLFTASPTDTFTLSIFPGIGEIIVEAAAPSGAGAAGAAGAAATGAGAAGACTTGALTTGAAGAVALITGATATGAPAPNSSTSTAYDVPSTVTLYFKLITLNTPFQFFYLRRYLFQDGGRRRPTAATMAADRHLRVVSEDITRAPARATGTMLKILPRPWVAVRIAAVIAATCCDFTPTAGCVAMGFPAGAKYFEIKDSPPVEKRLLKNMNVIPPSTKKTIEKAILV